MRETFTSGSVGRAPGNRCLYPETIPTAVVRQEFRAYLEVQLETAKGRSKINLAILCSTPGTLILEVYPWN